MSSQILAVDDEPDIRAFLVRALADEGYRVASAANGVAALAQVDAHPPRLILLDMRMPIMDGWQFARAYRERVESPAPIVVLTAASDARIRAREIAADAHLAKPFELDELLTIVRRWIEPAADGCAPEHKSDC